MGLFSSRPAPALLDDESLEKRYKWSNRTVYTGLAAMIVGSLALGVSVASLMFPAIVPTLPSLIGACMIWGGLQVYSSNFKDARACGAEKLSRLQAKVAAEQEAHATMPEPAAPEFNTKAAITLDTAMRVKHALKIKAPGGLFPA